MTKDITHIFLQLFCRNARIEKLISRLRAKLEPTPARPRFVITVRGRGYKLSNPQGMPNRPNGDDE